MKPVWIVGVVACLSLTGMRVPNEFPVPPHTKQSLFYIHRNLNYHSVVYDINLTEKGVIDPDAPVKIYWIRYGEKNKYKELNYMERTFAYGLKSQRIGPGRYRASFVAKKEKSVDVYVDEQGQATALMKIDNKISKLVRIFVQVAEDGWWPKVAYVEFFGTDFITNLPTYEKLVID